ncbi:CynX/NimT family MFS transporter [Streptomyces sp. NPDC091272]|uniref:CynX/NimT family MFS transporter n=1 Tax=Streptomyces sp. NPDC091272 TaxID=3365981 RepID=UPI003809769C
MPVDETRTLSPEPSTAQKPRTAPVDAPRTTPAYSVWLVRLMVVGLVLAALNLRPAITSLGPLLEEVRKGLGMSGAVAGLVTSVPSVCFAVFGIMAPRLARRFGPAAIVCAGMTAIAVGLFLRPFAGGTAGFLAASALALVGIAVSNILLPAIVKQWFPDRVSTMTGLYSMALAIGTSLAALSTVPLTGALGGSWQTGLAVWGVLAVLALSVWVPLAVRHGRARAQGRPSAGSSAKPSADGPEVEALESAAEAPAAAAPALRMVRSRTAWALACFFGLQATAAYITMGWMPQIFRDAGISAGTSGMLLALTMAMGIPLAFVIPRVATRLTHQGPVVLVLGLCGLSGYAGLYLAPAGGAWVWALLLGVSNCAFPLALTMIGLRARSHQGVVKLSAFAQSIGYLISIPGPLLIGVLHDASGGWGLPIALMAALMVPQMAVGVLAGRNRTIERELAV